MWWIKPIKSNLLNILDSKFRKPSTCPTKRSHTPIPPPPHPNTLGLPGPPPRGGCRPKPSLQHSNALSWKCDSPPNPRVFVVFFHWINSPPSSHSHHQDYYVFEYRSPPLPRGVDPSYPPFFPNEKQQLHTYMWDNLLRVYLLASTIKQLARDFRVKFEIHRSCHNPCNQCICLFYLMVSWSVASANITYKSWFRWISGPSVPVPNFDTFGDPSIREMWEILRSFY